MRILDWHINTSAGFTPKQAFHMLGFIPEFLSIDDPRPAWEQIHDRYIGGWQASLPGKWKLDQDGRLYFPGDPPLTPVASAWLRSERIYVYCHAWVCIAQPDGQFSVARLD